MTHFTRSLLLGAGLLAASSAPLDARPAVLSRHLQAIAAHIAPGVLALAQAEVRIPSDAQLERIEERAITTPPLDAGAAPGAKGSEEAEIRQMDERDRRIDQQLMGRGAICADCK